MKEIRGNIWDSKFDKFWRAITTNGVVKDNGQAVMGKGCAKEAADLFPTLPTTLGSALKENGNRVYIFEEFHIITFPTKHNWRDKASLKLIGESTLQLRAIAKENFGEEYVIVRPGCGYGNLSWENVRPVLSTLPDNVLVVTF